MMKQLAVLILFVLTLQYCTSPNTEQQIKLTTIKIDKREINLGQIENGKPQRVTFTLENTGTVPLLISDVKTECGCTKPTWEKHPIKCNEETNIEVTYDAKYPGAFIKTMRVKANTKRKEVELTLKGEVVLPNVNKQ